MKFLRFMSALLVVVMLATLMPLSAIAATVDVAEVGEVLTGDCGAEGSNVTYSLDTTTGVLTIAGTGAMKDYASNAAPWRMKYDYLIKSIIIESGVTSIGNHTFDNCYAFTSVVIPEGVTSIGEWAFSGCRSLTSIEIPEGVTSIGERAFSGCRSLTSITIPDSVTSIGGGAFYGCSSLTSITIPEGVTSIGMSAFESCTRLTSIEIPEGVTRIGEWAFFGCKGLTSIEIPEGVTSIGDGAFRYCDNLTDAYIYSKNATFGSSVFESTHADFTIHGYEGSTAQAYAEANNHNFVALVGEPEITYALNGGTFGSTPAFDGVLTADHLPTPERTGYVFTGWYTDEACTTPAVVGTAYTESFTLYAGWESVGTVTTESGDTMASAGATASGFELFGAQFREETSIYSTGLRFCSRVSKSLLSTVADLYDSDVQYGYVLCKKSSLPSGATLEAGTEIANGVCLEARPSQKDYFSGSGYAVYTAVVTGIPESEQSTEIAARPYISYKDASGISRYYYFTETGAGNTGGGYATSYSAVVDAHNAAQ